MFLTSGGKYSKSLSPKYKARRVSEKSSQWVSFDTQQVSMIILTKLEEISWQNIFVQVVIRQIQNLEHRKGTEAAKIKQIIN